MFYCSYVAPEFHKANEEPEMKQQEPQKKEEKEDRDVRSKTIEWFWETYFSNVESVSFLELVDKICAFFQEKTGTFPRYVKEIIKLSCRKSILFFFFVCRY